MKIFKTAVKAILVFDAAYLCFVCAEDVCSRIRSRMKKENKTEPEPYLFDDEEEEFEPYKVEDDTDASEPSLSIDAIRHLFRSEVHDFVSKKLLPYGKDTLSTLIEQEQSAARFLFCALIGYLKEEAPMDEQNFPMVMMLLNHINGAKESGEVDAVDLLMEEAAQTHQREEYISDYRRYQLMQVDKARVLLACRVIINDLLGKLYRFDYHVGYDCLLDADNSISRKLKESDTEMEVEEDAPGNC